jgi:septum formation topological specificity factor MinE
MGRRKGSLNKKTQHIQLDFEDNKNNIKKFDEKTEVCMTTGILEEVIEVIEKPVDLAQESVELEQIQQELDLARVELEKTRIEIEEAKRSLKSIPIESKASESPAVAIKDVSAQNKIAEQKARDSVMVTGKFYNLRVPGRSEKLPYQKYGDEPVKWHPFNHGQVYTIPKGFADQINGGSETDPCYYMPRFIKNDNPIIDPDNPDSGIHAVDTSNKKFSFLPLGFS